MERDFEDRVALVTGGGSGIGRATALRLGAAGASVLVANRSADAGEAVAAEIEAAGGTAAYVRADVAEEASVHALFAKLDDRFGALHVLVNSAGTVTPTTLPDTSLAEWERVFAVNTRGTFLCCREAYRRLGPPHASIVNVASVAGMVGIPERAAYCASKAAVIAMTRAMAVDHVREGVRVNCVCPGTIDSPWIDRLVEGGASRDALADRQPLGRLGTPEEVADAIVYLASERAAFTTGSAVVVDGGLTAA